MAGVPQLQIPGYAQPRDLDFSSLAALPQVYRQAQARETLANLQRGPDGQIDTSPLYASGDMSLANLGMQIDRNRALDSRDSRDFQFRQQQATQAQGNSDREHALRVRALAAKEPNELERRAQAGGLMPGTAEYQQFMLRGGRNADVTPSVAEKKEIFKSEDELPNIQGTIEALGEAKRLNKQTFSGVTAGTRAFIGSNVPGGGMLVDKAAADATTEWQKIMGPEALKTMADTLKGATTDFELRKFTEMLADPTTKPEIRERVIDRMIKLAERQKSIKERRIRDLPGGGYFKPQGQQPPAAPRTTGPTTETREIPQGAIQALRSNPDLKDEFEAKYGAGTAAVLLR